MSKLMKLLKESNLSPEATKLVIEALDEEKRAIAADIRLELTERYEADKTELVEGMDKMVQAVINEEMDSYRVERRKLAEDRVRLRTSLTNFSKFANSVLAEEVHRLRGDRRALAESLVKFMDFSNRIIAEELREFHVDRKRLVETRVKLLANANKQINEAKRAFVKRAAAEASQFIEESTRRELSELRVQLTEARENMFGRKIYEAFANEFGSAMFKKDPVLRDMQRTMRELNNKILESTETTNQLLAENAKLSRAVKVMADNKTREKLISEMVKPLSPTQRRIMESLLVSSPTGQLTADFNKYLSSVLSESVQPKPAVANQKRTLAESAVAKTGDRKTVVVEEADDGFDQELAQLVKHAGIR